MDGHDWRVSLFFMVPLVLRLKTIFSGPRESRKKTQKIQTLTRTHARLSSHPYAKNHSSSCVYIVLRLFNVCPHTRESDFSPRKIQTKPLYSVQTCAPAYPHPAFPRIRAYSLCFCRNPVKRADILPKSGGIVCVWVGSRTYTSESKRSQNQTTYNAHTRTPKHPHTRPAYTYIHDA